jgi:microcin C transport system ATP-binding protein
MTQSQKKLISIENLSVEFGSLTHRARVVHDVNFEISKGEKVALVGESGSGKSVTALSILQLHDRAIVRYPNGRIIFNQQDLLQNDEAAMRSIRGKDIAMIFQEPMTALNPVYSVGNQLLEPLMVHEGMGKNKARKRMIELLDRTGIVEPHKRFDAFPHMLSGGQRQRVMIAMALACSPQLLIADEPTTALDVTIQAQILDLMEDLQKEFSMAILMITHDLNMVRRFADRICVMQDGLLVEQAGTQTLFDAPQHEYTRHLLASQPTKLVDDISDAELEKRELIIRGENVNCAFAIKAGFFRHKVGEVRAVDNISLSLHEGETIGVVGESGSGKTTLGMCLLQLQQCRGSVSFQGQSLQDLTRKELRKLRRHFQVVFQDPFASLSPRMTIEQILREGLEIHFPQQSRDEHKVRILQVLQEVGLDENMLYRYPHEFSGGQRQRIAIARVVVLEPKLILLDEPTSALDVSVQKQVLELLVELQNKHDISYIFITHDLRVIRAMAHRVLVMRKGKVVEQGNTETLFQNPEEEYTQELLHATLD